MSGDAENAAQALAERHGLRYVDLSRVDFPPAASTFLPEETARRYRAVPVERQRGTTVVALANPADPLVMDAVKAGVAGEFVAVVSPPEQVNAAISQVYGKAVGRSRRRGQHAVFGGESDDLAGRIEPAASVSGGRFLTADALLARAMSNGPSAPPEPRESGVTSLEESLRDVLAAPDVHLLLPPPPPPPADAEPPDANPPDADPAGGGEPEHAATPAHAAPPEDAGAPPGHPPTAAAPAAPPTAAPPSRNGGPPHERAPRPAAAPGVTGAAEKADAPPVPASNGAGAHGGATKDLPPAAANAAPNGAANAAANGAAANGTHAPAAAGSPTPPEEPPRPPAGTSSVRAEPAGPAPATTAEEHRGPRAPDAPPPTAPPPPPPGYDAVARPPGADLHWPPLARVLVTSGRVSYDDMVRALRAHREAGESLARYLFSQQLATEEDLVKAMAEEVGLEFIDLSAFPVDAGAASLIPDAVARRHMVLPIRIENGVPIVAMANPTDVFAMDDLRSIMGRNFTAVVATRSQISAHLRSLQETDTDVEEAAQSAAGAAAPGVGGFELESLQSVVEDAPIVRYVNLLILQALNERASDIHIEPSPRRLRIRFRIDGVMHDASSASPAIHASVVSRLKVLGEMDITEHRVPQEGRVSVSVGDRQIDLRLATLPTLYGETCVMRLLDKSASIRRLSELGFLPDTLERYANTYNHPYGVILVTGPTGAGKTTTLYATLQEVMSKEKSVVTVEDPVEYQIDGINQVQINPKVGLQFSTALRSILRADPDIILVGEIRDIETATIAMEAALSGHLVLSTLHTNTAASTPLRLTEMGIEPFLVTSAVGSVLTQRLARVLCDRCKTPYEAALTDFYAAGYRDVDLEGLDVSTLYRANGCRTCSHTGYHGRMVLAEVMPITEEIERMIIEQQSIVAMERIAVEQGMRTLRQDGLRKAVAGVTTLEEVLRVVV